MTRPNRVTPDFRSPEFLRSHARDTMDFYHPRALDPSGGLFHLFKDNGDVYDPYTRHLASSTRFVCTYAMASRTWGTDTYRAGLKQAFDFLKQAHRNPATGGYAWLLEWRNGQAQVLDDTCHAYGLAFVLLAHAHAHMAGLPEAHAGIADTFDLLEQHFWEPHHGLYADEATPDWTLKPYRGQNANMHLCEALLAAFDAPVKPATSTGPSNWPTTSASARLLAGGLVREHYHDDWQVDWDYNRHDSSNIFRPWGFQPGHLTEWTSACAPTACHWLRGSSTSTGRSLGHHPRRAYGFAPTAAFAMRTNTSGFRLKPLQRPRAWRWRNNRPGNPTPPPGAGPHTTACGPTPGPTLWTMSTARGGAS